MQAAANALLACQPSFLPSPLFAAAVDLLVTAHLFAPTPPRPAPPVQVANRGLCAVAQAESMRYKLLGGLAVRRACYGVLRFVMESGELSALLFFWGGRRMRCELYAASTSHRLSSRANAQPRPTMPRSTAACALYAYSSGLPVASPLCPSSPHPTLPVSVLARLHLQAPRAAR